MKSSPDLSITTKLSMFVSELPCAPPAVPGWPLTHPGLYAARLSCTLAIFRFLLPSGIRGVSIPLAHWAPQCLGLWRQSGNSYTYGGHLYGFLSPSLSVSLCFSHWSQHLPLPSSRVTRLMILEEHRNMQQQLQHSNTLNPRASTSGRPVKETKH